MPLRELVDLCWHSRLRKRKRKVLLASIENSENWRDIRAGRGDYPRASFVCQVANSLPRFQQIGVPSKLGLRKGRLPRTVTA
jgi:hypothetical protein